MAVEAGGKLVAVTVEISEGVVDGLDFGAEVAEGVGVGVRI